MDSYVARSVVRQPTRNTRIMSHMKRGWVKRRASRVPRIRIALRNATNVRFGISVSKERGGKEMQSDREGRGVGGNRGGVDSG